jgi:hypothetical protein
MSNAMTDRYCHMLYIAVEDVLNDVDDGNRQNKIR